MSTLLDDITSGDTHRIWASACAIANLRDIRELDLLSAQLPQIEKATRGIDLGGALFPNREHLAFAIRKLRYYQAKTGCLCRLYPHRLFFDPAKEEAAGNVCGLETIDDTPWSPVYQCQCAECGTGFRIQEGHYHYPWWDWKIAALGGLTTSEAS